MKIKIWDNYRKLWLSPMAILFGYNDEIERVEAHEPNTDPHSHGWYVFTGKDLQHVAIEGDIDFNIHLLPTS